jgi:hypothetical protein
MAIVWWRLSVAGEADLRRWPPSSARASRVIAVVLAVNGPLVGRRSALGQAHVVIDR